MRYRVDFLDESGYISLDESEYDKAMDIYIERGIRMRRCRNIHDEGVVIWGAPIVEDLTRNKHHEN